jgi:hypothetical protein
MTRVGRESMAAGGRLSSAWIPLIVLAEMQLDRALKARKVNLFGESNDRADAMERFLERLLVWRPSGRGRGQSPANTGTRVGALRRQ